MVQCQRRRRACRFLTSLLVIVVAIGCRGRSGTVAPGSGLVIASPQAVTIPATAPATRPTTATTRDPNINRWEDEINALTSADEQRPHKEKAILFVGSSSIRGWRTLRADFPDLDVINRGFGGSEIIDVVRYADRIVLKYRPRTIVFYAGENDLAARKGERPEDVLRHFRAFVDVVHRELPQTRVLFISLKPSPSRAQYLEAYRSANRLVEQYTQTDPRLGYIDVFTPMLDAQGQPREELFLGDRLHMRPAGYELWTSIVRPHLDDAAPATSRPAE